MDSLDIARWQFGITTIYHFLLVPLTLGLGPMVVVFQTLYVRTGNERYLRMTKFWSLGRRWPWKVRLPPSSNPPSWGCGSSGGAAHPPGDSVGRRDWQLAVGFLDHRGELVEAASGRSQPGQRSTPPGRHLGGAHEQHGARRVLPHACWLARGGGRVLARHQLVPPLAPAS